MADDVPLVATPVTEEEQITEEKATIESSEIAQKTEVSIALLFLFFIYSNAETTLTVNRPTWKLKSKRLLR